MSLGKSVNLSFFSCFGRLGRQHWACFGAAGIPLSQAASGHLGCPLPRGVCIGLPSACTGTRESAVPVLAFDGLLPLSAFCCDASGIPADALAGSWLLCAAARPVA